MIYIINPKYIWVNGMEDDGRWTVNQQKRWWVHCGPWSTCRIRIYQDPFIDTDWFREHVPCCQLPWTDQPIGKGQLYNDEEIPAIFGIFCGWKHLIWSCIWNLKSESLSLDRFETPVLPIKSNQSNNYGKTLTLWYSNIAWSIYLSTYLPIYLSIYLPIYISI